MFLNHVSRRQNLISRVQYLIIRICQKTQLKISQRYEYMMLLEFEFNYIHEILYKTKDEENKNISRAKRLFKMRRNEHVIT